MEEKDIQILKEMFRESEARMENKMEARPIFTLRKFSCISFLAMFFPVFTSITVRASVGWIIRYAPDFNHTLSLNAS